MYQRTCVFAAPMLCLLLLVGASPLVAQSTGKTNRVLVTLEVPMRPADIGLLHLFMDNEAAALGAVIQNTEDTEFGRVYEFLDGAAADAFVDRMESNLAIEPGDLGRTTWRQVVTMVDRITWGTLSGALTQDPLYNLQWNLPKISWDSADALMSPSADSVKIAVLDTGVNGHPDFGFQLLSGKDFTGGNDPHNDTSGHGTAVAGIIGAVSNNSMAIAGIARNALIQPVKVFTDPNNVDSLQVKQGLKWARKHGAKIVNMSFVVGEMEQLSNQIAKAIDKDLVLIAAAGNDGTDTKTYPGAFADVMAVAASQQDDSKLPESNFGNWVKVAAPGVAIPSLVGICCDGLFQGTSVAAAHVSGVAAMLAGEAPCASSKKIRSFIKTEADAVPGGYVPKGRLDAFGAMQEAVNYVQQNCPQPPYIPGSEPIGAQAGPTWVAGYQDHLGNAVNLDSFFGDPFGLAYVLDLMRLEDGQYLKLNSVSKSGKQSQKLRLKFRTNVFPQWPQQYEHIRLHLSVTILSNDAKKREIEVRPYNHVEDSWGNDHAEKLYGSAQELIFEFNKDLRDLVIPFNQPDAGAIEFRVRIRHDKDVSKNVDFECRIDRAWLEVASE